MPFSKNTYCVKLYFEFDCLDCFSPIFASATESRLIFAPPTEKLPSPMAILHLGLIGQRCGTGLNDVNVM